MKKITKKEVETFLAEKCPNLAPHFERKQCGIKVKGSKDKKAFRLKGKSWKHVMEALIGRKLP